MSEKMKAAVVLVAGLCLCILMVANYYVRKEKKKYNTHELMGLVDSYELHTGKCSDGITYEIIIPEGTVDLDTYFNEFCRTLGR